MSRGQRFIIWGSAGHAKVLADIVAQQGGLVEALFDNNAEAQAIRKDIPLIIGEQGFLQWLATVNPADYRALVAIGGGRGEDRLQLQRLLNSHGVQTSVIQHQSASVSPTASIGAGTQILAQSVVAAEASLGEACIVNHRSSVDHECVIGNGVHLAPGTTLCGCVEIGDFTFVAAGSCVLPRVRIGAGSMIGAGSLVTRDIPEGVVAYGRPARVIRTL